MSPRISRFILSLRLSPFSFFFLASLLSRRGNIWSPRECMTVSACEYGPFNVNAWNTSHVRLMRACVCACASRVLLMVLHSFSCQINARRFLSPPPPPLLTPRSPKYLRPVSSCHRTALLCHLAPTPRWDALARRASTALSWGENRF